MYEGCGCAARCVCVGCPMMFTDIDVVDQYVVVMFGGG